MSGKIGNALFGKRERHGSKEGLITLKTISGREQDLLDIKNLLETNNEG